MTVVAWDGKTLAADKRATSGGYGITTTKIFRVHGNLIGMAGPGDVCRRMLEWARCGFDPSTFPAEAKDADCDMLVIDKDGVAACFGSGPYPLRIEDKFVALGCGRDFALAAMHLGRTAVQAVELACAMDIHCGNGIDSLELE